MSTQEEFKFSDNPEHFSHSQLIAAYYDLFGKMPTDDLDREHLIHALLNPDTVQTGELYPESADSTAEASLEELQAQFTAQTNYKIEVFPNLMNDPEALKIILDLNDTQLVQSRLMNLLREMPLDQLRDSFKAHTGYPSTSYLSIDHPDGILAMLAITDQDEVRSRLISIAKNEDRLPDGAWYEKM